MSQHDLIIDNAAGAVVRADINLALQALGSQSAGTAAPSTTYAYQVWYGTAAGEIKVRNAANTAWITLWDISTDGGLVLGAATGGSKGAATLNIENGYYFDGDPLGLRRLELAVIGGAVATVDLSNFSSAYDSYRIWLQDVRVSSAPGILQLQMELNSSLKIAATYHWNRTTFVNGGGTPVVSDVSSETTTQMNMLGDVESAAGGGLTGYIDLPAANLSGLRRYAQWDLSHFDDAAGDLETSDGSGAFVGSGDTDVITGVRFKFSGGNIQSGTFRLYGYPQ